MKNILKAKRGSNIFAVLLSIFLSATLVLGCSSQAVEQKKLAANKTKTEGQEKAKNKTEDAKSKDQKTEDTKAINGVLKVSYIDVGQADSILIQQGDSSMLIDAGNNPDDKTVKSYIDSQGITKLDYVIGTHPHEDHIGGTDYIIKSFKVGKVYLPKATSNTKTFESVITAIKNKNMQISKPTLGDTFKLGQATCTILGPINSDDNNLNTYSIVVKVVFGNNKFLFTGDAEKSNEQDMINAGLDLSADVLKVGHHGSYSSSSEAFLAKVNPKYAVISCGKDNDYGHPHKATMDLLKSKKIPLYRTDESGTIVATSDGNSIKFNVGAGDYKVGSTTSKKK